MEKQELSYFDTKYVLLESDIIMMLDLLYCTSARIKAKDIDIVYTYMGLVKCIARDWCKFNAITILQYKYIETLINNCFYAYRRDYYDDCLIYLYKIRNYVSGLV